MPSLDTPSPVPAAENQGLPDGLPDFGSSSYKTAYSRINAIVIEGEQEAHDN